jgi:hypothetical protein
MPIFDVKQSQGGSAVAFPNSGPATVDIGLSEAAFRGMGRQHAGLVVVSGPLPSADDIDRAVDRIAAELEELRANAKKLLGSLKGLERAR